MISDLSSMPKNTSTDISDQVERQVPGIVLRAQDVVNERLKQKRRRLGLYTSTQHFLHELQSDPTILHSCNKSRLRRGPRRSGRCAVVDIQIW